MAVIAKNAVSVFNILVMFINLRRGNTESAFLCVICGTLYCGRTFLIERKIYLKRRIVYIIKCAKQN